VNGGPGLGHSNRKYRPSEKQKPDAIMVGDSKRLASRFYQLKTDHCLTGQYLHCQQKPLWAAIMEETKKLPGLTRWRDRTKIAELLADERCSQAVHVFLTTADVGRTSGPPVAGDGDGEASEASEWEDKEREERLA